MVSRETIASALRALNEAENARPTSSVEETSARIDALMAADVEGWRNRTHIPDRATERALEMKAFGALGDYNRVFERVIIDPPLACIGWTIRGSFEGEPVLAPGCSNFEFDGDGKIRKYWMYFDPADFAYRK